MGMALNQWLESAGLWLPFNDNWLLFERAVILSMSWCFLVIAALTPYLYKRLIPLFDKRFKHLVGKHHEHFTVFHKFCRMGAYASWVASTRIFARAEPAVRAHDFAGEVSPAVRTLCWIFTGHGIAFVLISFILIAGQFLNGWLNGEK